jgi:hypothetical protein
MNDLLPHILFLIFFKVKKKGENEKEVIQIMVNPNHGQYTMLTN